jgi:hypothetical protein
VRNRGHGTVDDTDCRDKFEIGYEIGDLLDIALSFWIKWVNACNLIWYQSLK